MRFADHYIYVYFLLLNLSHTDCVFFFCVFGALCHYVEALVEEIIQTASLIW